MLATHTSSFWPTEPDPFHLLSFDTIIGCGASMSDPTGTHFPNSMDFLMAVVISYRVAARSIIRTTDHFFAPVGTRCSKNPGGASSFSTSAGHRYSRTSGSASRRFSIPPTLSSQSGDGAQVSFEEEREGSRFRRQSQDGDGCSALVKSVITMLGSRPNVTTTKILPAWPTFGSGGYVRERVRLARRANGNFCSAGGRP